MERAFMPLGLENLFRGPRNEGIPSPPLSAFDAFEQVSVRLSRRELKEGGDGCLHVGDHFRVDGNQVSGF